MMRSVSRLSALSAITLVLVGCSSLDVSEAIQDTNQATLDFTYGRLELRRTEQQQKARLHLTEQLLTSLDAAVQVALANSPAVQALLAQRWAEFAAAEQTGRIANPVFSFEQVRFQDELEFGRLLSFGLLDLLTLPQRRTISRNQIAQARIQLTASVVAQVTQVRQAWVRAVASEQSLAYAKQVRDSAQASAELARRMQQVGNFTRMQRARQHAFYADAAAELASAQHSVTAAREELVRQLGLDDIQATRLQLPDRLPDIPKDIRLPADVRASALAQRLDVQLARHQLDIAGKLQGLNLLNSIADVELGVRRDTVFDNAAGTSAPRKGYELAIRLPIFDWGSVQRDAMNAQALAAANLYDSVVRSASSHLRESYSAYRTAHDLARHYRDEIVPLRKTMAEENVLRYNGMLIGVFELLADSRDQISVVMAAINAQQQFWLADTALSAAVIGKPTGAVAMSTGGNTGGRSDAGH